MKPMLTLFLSMIFCYLIGSISPSYIFGRLFKGIDIRSYGSSNLGATNVFRVMGPLAGGVVLLLDVAKGLVCAWLVADYALKFAIPLEESIFRILLGILVICGHNWSVFLKFRGGKGVATSTGVLFALAIKIEGLAIILGICLVIWILVVLLTRYISLASLTAGAAFPLSSLLLRESVEVTLFAIIVCVFVIYTHKSNIKRLLKGEERKIGQAP